MVITSRARGNLNYSAKIQPRCVAFYSIILSVRHAIILDAWGLK
jgi:hypothetical protein